MDMLLNLYPTLLLDQLADFKKYLPYIAAFIGFIIVLVVLHEMHVNKVMTVFYNYKDALVFYFTLLCSGFVGFVVYKGYDTFPKEMQIAYFVTLILGGFGLLSTLVITYKANKNPFSFLLAIIAKAIIAVVSLLTIVIIILITKYFMDQAKTEYRKKRRAIAGATVGGGAVILLSTLYTRYRDFSAIGSHEKEELAYDDDE